jgi:hypothetical protein
MNESSKVQAVLFQGYTTRDAMAWLKNHDYKPIKPVHLSGSLMRYRIRPPSFARYTTKVIHTPLGKIFLVLGWPAEKKM